MDDNLKTCRCPDYTFYNPVLLNCSGICQANCSTCTDASTCTGCTAPWQFTGTGCICPLPYLLVNGSCDGCVGFSDANGFCYNTCPAGTTTDTINKLCITCTNHADCLHLTATPYCSLNTSLCVGHKATFDTVLFNKINPSFGAAVSVSIVDSLSILITNPTGYTYTFWLD